MFDNYSAVNRIVFNSWIRYRCEHQRYSIRRRALGRHAQLPRPTGRPASNHAQDEQRWGMLAVLLLATAMDLIGTTIAILALPVIGAELGASAAALEWVIAAYSLSFGLGLITGGRLGDVYGRRRAFLAGLAGVTGASLLCGIAPTPAILIAARVAQGAFAALMIPQVLSIIASSFPAEDRAKAFGAFGATAGIATVIGPLLGGALMNADILGWRSVFLVNVPFGLAILAIGRARLPESRADAAPRLDLAGAGLLTVALVLLLLPLIEGQRLGWPHWTLAALAATVPAFAVFARQQRRRERRGRSPLIPPILFRQRSFVSGTIAAVAFFSVPPALLFVTAVTLQGIGFSPLHTAMSFVPLSLASVPAATLSVSWTGRLGRRVPLAGALVVALGIASLLVSIALAGAAVTSWTLLPGMLLTGAGLGLVSPTLIDVVLSGVEQRDAGAASGTLNTGLQIGGALGVAAIGLVYYAGDDGSPLEALSRGLWYALAVALLSAAAMLLLPTPTRDAQADAPDKREAIHARPSRQAHDDAYSLISALPLRIESYTVEPLARRMGPQQIRQTSLIRLRGAGEEGLGEDITPDTDTAPLALAGEWTIDSLSAHLDTLELFRPPEPHPMLRPFRRWALESAALDLALRQARMPLHEALGRTPEPVRFVTSPRLPDPPTAEPIRERLRLVPGLRFKLDPTAGWDDTLIDTLAATGAVDVLDLKGRYPPQAAIAQPPDPRLYQRVIEAFPRAWIEDPAITPATKSLLEAHRDRISWDAPLRSLADVHRLAVDGAAVNVKPVRFGTLRTLLAVYDHCSASRIPMYGGDFDEIGPGRDQIQYLASLFHPDALNDVAPTGYNHALLSQALPQSPLTPRPATSGFRWATGA
jgi:MFS family permease/L-alanine-DL-glutamate epimerase-like enolase superfamily enzyme